MRPSDLDATVAAIHEGGWGERRPELTFYLSHAEHTVYVAEREERILGTVLVTLSGGIGWLGLVWVAPELRGQGLGARLTHFGLDRLRDGGARSILLAASALGRPIYEKIGFTVDGEYAMLFGSGAAGAPHPSRVRRVEPRDVPSLGALDRLATSEEREHLIQSLDTGWVVEDRNEVRGYALRTPWGYGPAIAADPESGRLLLDVLRDKAPPDQEMRLMLPQDNRAAIDHLHAAQFEIRTTLPRMRLGEPVPWQPSRIFAVTNAALG